jgi:Na+/melibiose symporter-like transporter
MNCKRDNGGEGIFYALMVFLQKLVWQLAYFWVGASLGAIGVYAKTVADNRNRSSPQPPCGRFG